MSRPIFSVKHVLTRKQLPETLTVGRAYFVSDEQIIIIDHGDGRGPVTYGNRPGMQGIAGEPIPSLQGQIDELAHASVSTTNNLHMLNIQSRNKYNHLLKLLQDNMSMIKSQNEENANAIMKMIYIVHKKFLEFDNAISVLAANMPTITPGTSTEQEGSIPLITADDGTVYRIDQSYIDGDTGVIVLTLYDDSRITTLKEGDAVNLDNGFFIVNSVNDTENIITLTLYTE